MSEFHFDIQKNCESLSIDRNIYLRILDKAIQQTTLDIQQLRESLAQSDMEKIQSISHRLKGDYANLRIDDLSTIAKGINDISKSEKDPVRLEQLFQDLNKKFHVLINMVEKLKQN